MSALLFIVALTPIDSVLLTKEFYSIEMYNGALYCAPFTGKSIFVLDDAHNLKPLTFTDDPSYRIYEFHATPFALYINNGKSIQKFYTAAGATETVYTSSDISSFIITPSEEIIISERQKRILKYLDFTHQTKFTIEDLGIQDLSFADQKIYVLTKKGVLSYDEHGNILRDEKNPNRLNKIYADSTLILLFSPDKKYVYALDTLWEKIELKHGIRDITGSDEFLVILGDDGNTLYFYNKSQFE
jgi:hypothetical protein